MELAHLSRASQLGELSGAFAHELNQPLTSTLANAEAGARLLERTLSIPWKLARSLRDIMVDDKRAAKIIAQLRKLIVKGETTLSLLDLNEAVDATIALVRSELVARRTVVGRCSPEHNSLTVRANLAQLQQVIINLVLNAADAMSQLVPSQRRIAIWTRKRDDGFSELAVSDQGSGSLRRHAGKRV